MYGKLFASAFTGSMAGAGEHVFAVWAYVLAHAVDSTVEINPKIVAATIGMDVARVKVAMDYLTAPDPDSRNPDKDGRRLLALGPYAYHVVSHQLYRSIRSEDDRREYNRRKQQESRARRQPKSAEASLTVNDKYQPSMTINDKCPLSAHTEAEADTEANTKERKQDRGDQQQGAPIPTPALPLRTEEKNEDQNQQQPSETPMDRLLAKLKREGHGRRRYGKRPFR